MEVRTNFCSTNRPLVFNVPVFKFNDGIRLKTLGRLLPWPRRCLICSGSGIPLNRQPRRSGNATTLRRRPDRRFKNATAFLRRQNSTAILTPTWPKGSRTKRRLTGRWTPTTPQGSLCPRTRRNPEWKQNKTSANPKWFKRIWRQVFHKNGAKILSFSDNCQDKAFFVR